MCDIHNECLTMQRFIGKERLCVQVFFSYENFRLSCCKSLNTFCPTHPQLTLMLLNVKINEVCMIVSRSNGSFCLEKKYMHELSFIQNLPTITSYETLCTLW